MASNVYGESSKEGMNGETDISQPKLKKARFLWEVKGKHHLKEYENKISQENESQAKTDPLKVDLNKESKNNSTSLSTPNISNNRLIQDYCCVQSFLEKSGNFIHSSMGEACVSCCHNDMENANFARWHNKQMVRYDIENKINAAIEMCSASNLEDCAHLDVANIVNEIENDIEVNNRGILMAIKSCGLKTHDCIPEEIQQDPCHVTNECVPSKSSVPDSRVNVNKPEIHMTHSTESISDDNHLQTDEAKNYEMNSKFWNTAVSAAIYEKGLTYN
ncbi:hypothetical protein WA026_014462 [Henosepilachna vigintioctopunctata]|uniref:Uncharacterized protein n=1 Tax=Henosepilachna vigintioctopunctata TaxID=420089 RepID=A0AAW1UNU0_9CUCU